jgi:hypothetical protein
MVAEMLQDWSGSEDMRKGGSDELDCMGKPFILLSVSSQALGAGCVAMSLTDCFGWSS